MNYGYYKYILSKLKPTMKTYILNNIEVSAEEIQKLVRENPDLLKPEVKGRYFFPKEGEEYWFVTAKNVSGVDCNRNTKHIVDIDLIALGVFKTREEAQLENQKRQAIVACWKWAQENAPFEPDWGNSRQNKYFTYYDHETGRLEGTSHKVGKIQFTLPYFKSEEDCEAFVKANKENLELLFTK